MTTEMMLDDWRSSSDLPGDMVEVGLLQELPPIQLGAGEVARGGSRRLRSYG